MVCTFIGRCKVWDLAKGREATVAGLGGSGFPDIFVWTFWADEGGGDARKLLGERSFATFSVQYYMRNWLKQE